MSRDNSKQLWKIGKVAGETDYGNIAIINLVTSPASSIVDLLSFSDAVGAFSL